ncbi:UDP-N-acetylmuramate dehydrogenase [Noviherbaspirillum aridicola]|uniref:UDP-N-acetylenolpyruvoylglucosamine reductase n=1 Tax=Noviherbaspirillum aridicola TaxID=2849687 RepID=A0ABQ4Q0Y6_9BURK|nr:UDP-N-acetylmuramate dehydrogenase [Noviherbaspirillum aridicola]GIZ50662.1 UDP-N-acetylenolpyruvoylglucosamine reductase [Noviherbaspirillum aridicola]
MALPIQTGYPLRQLNTFGIDARAAAYLQVTNENMLAEARRDPALAAMPRLVLGGGSNLLFTRDFDGLVLHMATSGIDIVGEDEASVFVRAAAGENWHRFVLHTVARGLPGLENLSLIPGSVGAAPIQNIGAYGAELKDCFHALRAFDFDSGKILELGRAACRFGYRDSIFKHELARRAVILDVTFALPKQWQPNLRYAELAQELAARGKTAPGAADISDAVVAIRSRKLPDPASIGNAGSFFKNPVVSRETCDALLARFPGMVSYAQPDGSCKLAAGWLIDQCGWKGRSIGPAGVYEKQALVLVNRGGASGRDIAELARAVQADVMQRFGVMLEPEPVFV